MGHVPLRMTPGIVSMLAREKVLSLWLLGPIRRNPSEY